MRSSSGSNAEDVKGFARASSSNGFTARIALKVFQDTDIKLIVVGTSRAGFHQDVFTILEQKEIPIRFSSEVEYAYPEVVRNAYRKMSEG